MQKSIVLTVRARMKLSWRLLALPSVTSSFVAIRPKCSGLAQLQQLHYHRAIYVKTSLQHNSPSSSSSPSSPSSSSTSFSSSFSSSFSLPSFPIVYHRSPTGSVQSDHVWFPDGYSHPKEELIHFVPWDPRFVEWVRARPITWLGIGLLSLEHRQFLSSVAEETYRARSYWDAGNFDSVTPALVKLRPKMQLELEERFPSPLPTPPLTPAEKSKLRARYEGKVTPFLFPPFEDCWRLPQDVQMLAEKAGYAQLIAAGEMNMRRDQLDIRLVHLLAQRGYLESDCPEKYWKPIRKTSN